MQVPLNRLLLETDAPDGRPQLGAAYQDKLFSVQQQDSTEDQELNHPANIRHVCLVLNSMAAKEQCACGKLAL